MRQALKGLLTRWPPLAAMLLALGAVLAISLLARSDHPLVKRTPAICNANRHGGVGPATERAISARERNAAGDCGVCVMAPFVIGGLSWCGGRET
jgi:hypothetical protein